MVTMCISIIKEIETGFII